MSLTPAQKQFGNTHRRKDLTGQKIHFLTAIQPVGKYKNHLVWLCKCDCGNETKVSSPNFRRTKSCGCLGKPHFHAHSANGKASPTYVSWRAMLARCKDDPKNRYYKDYASRGIKVCERWLDFRNFLEDVGVRPEGKTLDRIDNDKGYFKENCRWSTHKEQIANKRPKVFKSELEALKKKHAKLRNLVCDLYLEAHQILDESARNFAFETIQANS